MNVVMATIHFKIKFLIQWILFAMGVLCLHVGPTLASPYSFGSGRCKIHGTWTEEALTATHEILSVTQGLRNAEGCGEFVSKIENHLEDLQNQIKTLEGQKDLANKLSQLQDEVLLLRQYSLHPGLRTLSTPSMVASLNELAALSVDQGLGGGASNDPLFDRKSSSPILPNLGDRIFQVNRSGLTVANKLLEAITAEEMKCLSAPNLLAPFFSSMAQLSAALVSSGQDFFGKDVSLFVSRIASLARNTHFDRITRELQGAQFQNSMSCLLDSISEGYCATLDAQILFNEEMKRLKPISWTWNTNQFVKAWGADTSVNPGDFDKLKRTVFEGYYVLTQQLPVVTAFLERIQRGIPPKNQSDANFQNSIQSNTFGYFINERNIIAEWNMARSTIANMSNLESQQTAIADSLKKLARLIIGEPNPAYTGINFLERVTNFRKVIFQLMGKEIPQEVVGRSGMQIRSADWLDVNYQTFIGNPQVAMIEISKNLETLLASANQVAVEYYNYWFIADQPGLMVDSLTGMTYNVPEALEGINQYLLHLSKQDYVDGIVLSAIYETIDKINRILGQYKVLRNTGLRIQTQYGDLTKYPVEERRQILQEAMNQYKELIELFYSEFSILKARSSYLVNRMTSFVKIDYQRRLRQSQDLLSDDEELLKQIYYATGDVVFERMRLISSKNPADIDADLNFAQRTFLQSLRSVEDLLRDNFAATIAQLQLEHEGADTTTKGLFEDSIIRANRASNANYYHQLQAWVSDRLYEGLPEFLKPNSRRRWNYFTADKLYGVTQMLLNPDLYPGIYALNPLRLLTKPEAPGIEENANSSILKTLGIMCIQSLAMRDPTPFFQLCKDIVLKSPLINDEMRQSNPEFPFYKFLDVKYKDLLSAYYPEGSTQAQPLAPKSPDSSSNSTDSSFLLFPDLDRQIDDPNLRRAKNFDARVCALRQRNRNNYIMFLTQGKDKQAP